MSYTVDQYWTDVDGLVRIKDDNTWLYGLLDSRGNVVVPCKYGMLIHLDDTVRLGAVEYRNKWGYINQYGHEVVPCEYERVGDRFCCGRAEVRKYGKSGFIDEIGRLVIPHDYDEVSFFIDDMVEVKKGDKWGIINKNGRGLWSCSYDKIYIMGSGIVVVGKRSFLGLGPIKYSIWDYNVHQVTDFKYDEIGNQVLNNGRILFKKGNTKGYVDKYGREYTTFG